LRLESHELLVLGVGFSQRQQLVCELPRSQVVRVDEAIAARHELGDTPASSIYWQRTSDQAFEDLLGDVVVHGEVLEGQVELVMRQHFDLPGAALSDSRPIGVVRNFWFVTIV